MEVVLLYGETTQRMVPGWPLFPSMAISVMMVYGHAMPGGCDVDHRNGIQFAMISPHC